MTSTDLRCPECGSLVRGGISWCTLCHADLRSDEEKEAAQLEAERAAGTGIALPSSLVLDESLDPVGALTTAARGRHARPSAVADPVAARLAAGPATTGTTRTKEAEPAADAVSGVPAVPAVPASPATSDETAEKLAELKQAGIDVDVMLSALASSSSGGMVDNMINRLSTKGSRAVAVVVGMAFLTSLGILLMFTLGSIFG